MVQDSQGSHHAHRRIRIHQKLEKFPHPNKWKRLMDRAIYVVGILGPIMTLPQLIGIWVLKNAAGVSVLSWIGYLVTSIFWLIYGMMHKDKPIMFTYSLWIIMDILIIIGTLVYR